MDGGGSEGTAGHPESVRPPSAEELDSRWQKARWSHPRRDRSNPYDDLNHRLWRAISWLRRAEAEREVDDCDAAFIFLWIAFNATYGQLGLPSGSRDDGYESESATFETYLKKVYDLDSGTISDITRNLSIEIGMLLDNKYVFEPYWKYRNGLIGRKNWERQFENQRKKRESAAWYKKTQTTLCQLFDRLYALRNQLLHGSATWKGKINRPQVETGAQIMATLVPHFINVMIRHPDNGWGAPRNPVVQETGPQSGWTDSAGNE